MTPFEDQLRQALRPVAPPPGFVERTLARAAGGQRPPARVIRFPRWIAAMAASLAVLVGGLQYHEYRRGLEAKQQLLLALEITGSRLAQTKGKIISMGSEK